MLFSGGADSAYIAYKILTETTDELTTFTMVNNPNDPGPTEWTPRKRFTVRLPKLLDELQKIRPFKTIEHSPSNKEIHSENDNHYLYGIEWVASYMNDGTYDRFVTGRTWEQQNKSVFKGSQLKGTPTYFASVNLWNKLVTRGVMWDPLVDNSFDEDYNRWHALQNLPQNIARHTISCHNPKLNEDETDVSDCNVCYKCLWNEKTRQFIDRGLTAKHLNTWRRMKSLEYGGGNNLSATIRYWIPLELGKGELYKVKDSSGNWILLNSKEKIQKFVQTEEYYNYRDRPKTGIWDFTNLLNGS